MLSVCMLTFSYGGEPHPSIRFTSVYSWLQSTFVFTMPSCDSPYQVSKHDS